MRTRERQTNFIDLFKSFWMPDEIETSFDEEIQLNSVSLSEEDKNLLKETSSHIKELEKELYNHSVEKTKRKSSKAKLDKQEMANNKSIQNTKQVYLNNREEKERE